tara:strand:+ start:1834 stop:2049 length:216 start_codon:yes stop_codon:yes gene_type:complete
MAKLRKLVTYTDYRWEEAELTEEQLALFKSDHDAFMENYYDGEYDFDWDLVRDKCLEDEEAPELIEEGEEG